MHRFFFVCLTVLQFEFHQFHSVAESGIQTAAFSLKAFQVLLNFPLRAFFDWTEAVGISLRLFHDSAYIQDIHTSNAYSEYAYYATHFQGKPMV